MGSFKLIFLIPFFTFAQYKAPKPTAREWLGKHDDVAHFYGSVSINEFSYQVSSWTFPKWSETKKVLISNAVTASCIFIKERYDMLKRNPTGWNWMDVFIGFWAIAIYDIFNICRFDFKRRDDYSFENKYLLVY
jgi:hypothetical protein